MTKTLFFIEYKWKKLNCSLFERAQKWKLQFEFNIDIVRVTSICTTKFVEKPSLTFVENVIGFLHQIWLGMFFIEIKVFVIEPHQAKNCENNKHHKYKVITLEFSERILNDFQFFASFDVNAV